MADAEAMPQMNDLGTTFEKHHVQHVYDEIAASMNDTKHKAWPNVKRFLKKFPQGSLIADIGCGNGRYLNINKSTYKVGVDVCAALVDHAGDKGFEVAYANNLTLPFRDNCFDGVVSIGVIHHFCSVERRIKALQELARVLRPGGQAMLYVWALEQKHRKFDSQDVLIPWRGSHRTRPARTGSSSSFGVSSTSSISEDESLTQSTDTESTKQTSRKPGSSLRRKSSFSADDVSCLLAMSDFKPNYYSLDFNISPQHINKPADTGGRPSSAKYCRSISNPSSSNSNKLITECRKLEASLRAMSSGDLEVMEYLCRDENFTEDTINVKHVEEEEEYHVNGTVTDAQSETGIEGVNGTVNEAELDVTLDWAVGDLENDDFETEIPNPLAYYDSGFIENGIHELDICSEERLMDENSEYYQTNREKVCAKHPKVNPFLKQNSLDPYTFNSVFVKQNSNDASDRSNSIELINECDEDVQDVFIEFKPARNDVAKKSEKSFFSAVKSKLLEIFDDKKDGENRKVKRESKQSKPKVDKKRDQSPLSMLSEEQLDLASRLNFKVREFPLSSCPDVVDDNTNLQDNSESSNHNTKWSTEADHTDYKKADQNRNVELTLSNSHIIKASNEFLSWRPRSHSESGLINGIYDGYMKIDVDRVNGDTWNVSENIQRSALDRSRKEFHTTRETKSFDVLGSDPDRDYQGTVDGHTQLTYTAFNGTCNTDSNILPSSIKSSQGKSLSNTCEEFYTLEQETCNFKSERFCASSFDNGSECLNSKAEETSVEQIVVDYSRRKNSEVDEIPMEQAGLDHRESVDMNNKVDDGVFDSEDVEKSSKLYRYYHVFREGEIEDLISNYVTDLHIVQCHYDHANWCVVAEKL